MTDNRGPDVQPGERWAYRKSEREQLTEVEVVRIGVRTPKRVLVRFIDDEFEGLQDWVPPARLKARWDDRQAFIDREARWSAVREPSPERETPEVSAAEKVIWALLDESLVTAGWNADEGVLAIHDVAGLADRLGIARDALEADPRSFVEDGDLRVPWPAMESVAHRLAAIDPDAVMRMIAKDEAKARHEAAFGHHYRTRGEERYGWIEPERCIAWDEEHDRPVREVLRSWCGAGTVDLHDELTALRRDCGVVMGLLDEAIAALRRGRNHHVAKELEAKLAEAGIRTRTT